MVPDGGDWPAWPRSLTSNEVTGELCENPVDKVLRTGKIVGLANHTVLKSKDGRQRAIDDSAAPIRSADGALLGVVLVFRDVTETREREARIQYLSFRDSLTGLHNRTYFDEEFRRLDREEHYPLALIMGDLDGLKLINDAFGYHVGDEALNKIADIVRSCCRPTDVVSRWGGDEFVVLLPNTTEDQAERICETIKVLACNQGSRHRAENLLSPQKLTTVNSALLPCAALRIICTRRSC